MVRIINRNSVIGNHSKNSSLDREVEFKGIYKLLRSTGLSEDAFTTLAPGESLKVNLDVAETADLSEGGSYTISSSGVFQTADETGTAIEGAVAFGSNELKLDVDGAEAAAVSPAFNPKVKRTALDRSSCSGSYLSIMQAGLRRCSSLASAAAQAVNGNAAKFQEYFLQNTQQARQIASARLQSVARECSSSTSGVTRYYCSDPYGQCQSNYIAYTFPTRNEVVNCPIFYQLPSAGTGCHQQDQGYTILHEMTHAQGVYSPYAQDYAYGYNAIRNLSPSQAIHNADTYSLFSLGKLIPPISMLLSDTNIFICSNQPQLLKGKEVHVQEYIVSFRGSTKIMTRSYDQL